MILATSQASESPEHRVSLDLVAFRPEEPRQARVDVSASARRIDGRRLEVLVLVEVEKGVHLYADPAPEGFEPLSIEVLAPDGATLGAPCYPEPHGGADGAATYDEAVEIALPVAWATEQGRGSLDILVRYQACTEQACFLPKLERLLVELSGGR